MGLARMPLSIQRLIETAIHGLPQVLAYIDDLLIHSDKSRIASGDFGRAVIKAGPAQNQDHLEECNFGSRRVALLGFHHTERRILLGEDKLKAVSQNTDPANGQAISQFGGCRTTIAKAHSREVFNPHPKSYSLEMAHLYSTESPH